ncbi:MAG: restriction endonuclease subunit S [Niameybacter sp.]
MKWQKLKDVVELTMGQSPSSESYNEDGNGMPFFQGKADFGKVTPKVRMYCTQPSKRAVENDILMSVRAPVGDVNICDVECCIGRGLASLRAKNEILNYKYLYYVLSSQKEQIANKGTGSTFKAINKGILEEIEIPIQDLDIQKKIVCVLDNAQELIDKRKEQIEACDQLVKSQFIEMFGDPFINPKGWEEVEVGKYLNILTDYHSNGSYETLRDNVTLLDKPDYALMVRTTDLEKGNYENDVKYIDEHAYKYLEKSKVFGGEIIINKIGSAGKVYLMPYLNRPVSLEMNQFLLRFDESKVNHVFMYHLLTTPCCERRIQDKVRGAVTKTITKDAVREVNVIMPPIELQNQFVQFVQQVGKLKFEMEQSFVELENNFNALMQRAFKGELF